MSSRIWMKSIIYLHYWQLPNNQMYWLIHSLPNHKNIWLHRLLKYVNARPQFYPSGTNAPILMCQEEVNVITWAKCYDPPELSSASKESNTLDASPRHLMLDKPIEPIYRSPRVVFQNSTHNPNAWATQHYGIVEDIAEAPCAISVLEVL